MHSFSFSTSTVFSANLNSWSLLLSSGCIVSSSMSPLVICKNGLFFRMSVSDCID